MARRRKAPKQQVQPLPGDVWWVEEVQGGPSVMVRVLDVDRAGNVHVELLTPPHGASVGTIVAAHVPALFREKVTSIFGAPAGSPPPWGAPGEIEEEPLLALPPPRPSRPVAGELPLFGAPAAAPLAQRARARARPSRPAPPAPAPAPARPPAARSARPVFEARHHAPEAPPAPAPARAPKKAKKATKKKATRAAPGSEWWTVELPGGAGRVLNLAAYEASVIREVERGHLHAEQAQHKIEQARRRVRKATQSVERGQARGGVVLPAAPLRPGDPHLGDTFVFHRLRDGQRQTQTMVVTGVLRDPYKNERLEITWEGVDYEGSQAHGAFIGRNAENFLAMLRRHRYTPGRGIEVVLEAREPTPDPPAQRSIMSMLPVEYHTPGTTQCPWGPQGPPGGPPVTRPPSRAEQEAFVRDFPQFAGVMPGPPLGFMAAPMPPSPPPVVAPAPRPRGRAPARVESSYDWITGGGPRVSRADFQGVAQGDLQARYRAGLLLGYIPAEGEVTGGSPRLPQVRQRELLLQLLHDGQARTWERISRELTGEPGQATSGSPLESELWGLVADQALEYRLAPPTLFRIRHAQPSGPLVSAGAPQEGEAWVVEDQGVRWWGVVLSFDPTGPMGGFVTVRPAAAPEGDPGVIVMASQLVRNMGQSLGGPP